MKLTELRRNPGLNRTENGHKGAVNYLLSQQKAGKSLENFGVSMTDLPKIGMNPRSPFRTPLGIYFYPAVYYLETKERNHAVEWKDNAKYIQIMELRGNVLQIDTMNETVYKSCIDTLLHNVDNIASRSVNDANTVKQALQSSISRAGSSAMVKSPGGKLWFILWEVSGARNNRNSGGGYIPKQTKNSPMVNKASVMWNYLLRLLGIDAIMDSGDGILHPNEPVAGVVINIKSIAKVHTVENTRNNNNYYDEE